MTEKEVDLCIVGGAGAGLAAAVSAKEAGAKKVILLEKMKKTGGCTRLAAGMFSVESPVQKRLGLHYTADECFIEHMDMSGWECDAKLVRKWMRSTGNVTRWLEEKGCFFDRVVTFAAGKRLYHMMEKSTGNEIVNQLTKASEEMGVEILLNTRATKLVTDNDGSVIGVLASQGDEELKVTAKSVILATGSISSNKELIARFYPDSDMSNVRIAAAAPHNTGDGLLMAEEIGAASTYISSLFLGPQTPSMNMRTGYLSKRPHLIKLNRDGERYADEAIILTRDWGWMLGRAMDRQPGKVAYSLMDENILSSMIANKKNYSTFERMIGSKRYMDTETDTRVEHVEGMSQVESTEWLDDIREDIRSEKEAGKVKIMNTLDEVAEYIGAKPETLKKTIAQYNTYCKNQYDDEFLKDPEFLLPITTPPYYVFKGYQGIDTCVGGLRINHNLEVLNKDLYPIKGLYGAGVVTGGWMNQGYGFWGSQMSFVFYSGYTVGKIATEYAEGKS